jgi:membrane-anchored glycerophosphoryl diester phosphodiesterase (GDPDase)
MSETPGWDRPDDDQRPEASEPPYPGWSTRQPPPSEWAAPGQTADSPRAADSSAMHPSGTSPSGGWGEPAASAAGTQWGWAPPPVVKPGVIPLRPLGVGEILDGAVTTIRRNPGPMLGLSAIVAVITQLLGAALGYLLFQDIPDIESLSPTASFFDVMNALAGLIGASAIVVIVTWIATVLLTGILTVVVSRAVLGEKPTVGQSWGAARPRLPRLLLLTIVYSLIWLIPFLVAGLVGVLLASTGLDDAGIAGIVGILLLLAIPVAIWLYVRYALSSPALMLESTPRLATGTSRPIGVFAALRRSAELVHGSWWRLFGILLLILLIAGIISQVISVPFALPAFFLDEQPSDNQFLLTLVVSALGGIVAATITAPFTAAATALLYVDRRIRREGLDIELARAAGVSIPGRTDPVPPTASAPGAP